MKLMHYFLLFCLPFLVSLITVRITITVSNKMKLFDFVDARKLHVGNISRLGGIGIFLGFFSQIFLVITLLTESIETDLVLLAISGISIFAMGLIDDIWQLHARLKFFVQLIASLLVVYAGFSFSFFSFKPLSFYLQFGIFSIPLTVIWIIGIINAINLIDGLDGQAGIISFLILIAYAFILFHQKNSIGSVFCIGLALSILGFLFYNAPFPKAKIFMGDSGSQFLGFMIAVLPLIREKETHESIGLAYSFVLLIIPIMDVIAAVWRRLRDKTGVATPDKFHIHHKLRMLGFSDRSVFLIMASLQIIIALLVIISFFIEPIAAAILLLTDILIVILFFAIVHYAKEHVMAKENKNADE